MARSAHPLPAPGAGPLALLPLFLNLFFALFTMRIKQQSFAFQRETALKKCRSIQRFWHKNLDRPLPAPVFWDGTENALPRSRL